MPFDWTFSAVRVGRSAVLLLAIVTFALVASADAGLTCRLGIGTGANFEMVGAQFDGTTTYGALRYNQALDFHSRVAVKVTSRFELFAANSASWTCPYRTVILLHSTYLGGQLYFARLPIYCMLSAGLSFRAYPFDPEWSERYWGLGPSGFTGIGVPLRRCHLDLELGYRFSLASHPREVVNDIPGNTDFRQSYVTHSFHLSVLFPRKE